MEEKYRKKKLLVADMDSTIIEQESLDELADEVGYGKKISQISANLACENFHKLL